MLGKFVAIASSAVAVATMGIGATKEGGFAAFSWRLYTISMVEMSKAVDWGAVTVSTVW